MPEDMEFNDVRRGSDLEFGQSNLRAVRHRPGEPLNFGAICCVSNVCGCIGFAEHAAGGLANLPNLVIADYVSLPYGYWLSSPYDALGIDRGVRNWIEGNNSAVAAATIYERLPKPKRICRRY